MEQEVNTLGLVNLLVGNVNKLGNEKGKGVDETFINPIF